MWDTMEGGLGHVGAQESDTWRAVTGPPEGPRKCLPAVGSAHGPPRTARLAVGAGWRRDEPSETIMSLWETAPRA